ncbi:MAG: substrate-binding domain-containing protein [Anaerolineae bacterium]|jgi:ribose transport system substrate-binding protein|nr:substrate-binding domain-containing protein [Anaerolineae bacterium]
MYRIVIFIVLTLILVACSPAAAPTNTPAPTATPIRVALVMKTLTNPFFVEMERGARRAEQELGIELIVRTAAQETSIEQQIEIVEELIQENIDAIVIAPGDSVELIPVLKRAQDAGIVVINIDNQLDPEFAASNNLTNVPFISVDNEEAAYQAVIAFTADITESTQAIVIEGIRGAKNAEDRKNGALRGFAENPNITVVANETANWLIDESYEVTRTLFEAHPEVKLVFAANDIMALGAIRYLSESNRTDVLVGGFDALSDAKEAIRAGDLVVTVDQQAAEQGYTGVQYAVRALNGETLPAETMIDVLIVTADNVGE